MEFGDEIAYENARYSFFLGSALRNSDADQFVQVYDQIIPSHYSEEQVCHLKTEACRIAELAEEDYSSLVNKAREFSLATSARTPSFETNEPPTVTAGEASHSLYISSSSHPPCCVYTADSPLLEEEEEEELPRLSKMEEDTSSSSPSFRPSFTSLNRTSRHFGPNTAANRQQPVEVNDRNMRGSSHGGGGKITINNDAAATEYCNEDEERGAFNYFRNSPSNVIKQELKQPTLPAGGDVAFDVEDDSPSTKSSDEDDRAYGLASSKNRFERTVKDDPMAGTEMQEIRSGKSTYYRDEEEEEFGYMPYTRQQSLNSLQHMTNTLQFDEHEEAVPSDDNDESLKSVVVEKNSEVVNLDRVTVHKSLTESPDLLFGRKALKLPHYKETDELNASLEQGPTRRIRPSQSSPQPPYQAKAQIMYSQVDKGIKFSGLSMSKEEAATSKGTNIMSSIRDRDRPPFGFPPEQARMMESGAALLSDSCYNTPANMPASSSVPGAEQDASANNKKKKKKKRKEDNADEAHHPLADENGNPISSSSQPLLSGAPNASYNTYNNVKVDQTAGTSAESNNTKKKSKKKAKDGKEIKVEELPGYRGDSAQVDDLVNFIESNDKKKKTAKNGPTSSSSSSSSQPNSAAATAAPQTVQAAVLPQQQKTPLPVDVNHTSKKVQPQPVPTTNHVPTAAQASSSTTTTTTCTTNTAVLTNVAAAPAKDNTTGNKKKKAATKGNGDSGGNVSNNVPSKEDTVVDNNRMNEDVKKEVNSVNNVAVGERTIKEAAAMREIINPSDHTVKELKQLAADQFNASSLDTDAESFIYTDWEVPHKEEEFKVVKKKDKKPKPPVQGNGWSMQKAHSMDCYDQIPSRTNVAQRRAQYAAVTRSVTPPLPPPPPMPVASSTTATTAAATTVSSAVALSSAAVLAAATSSSSSSRSSSSHVAITAAAAVTGGGGARDRAFSPSSFPSLPRSSQPRRNSTGNAMDQQDPAEFESDDSESVKSDSRVAPTAATGTKELSTPASLTSSSSSVISYAVIAAGRKAATGTTTAGAASSELCDHRERRYSDGGAITADNFPPMQASSNAGQHHQQPTTVSMDNRTCSSSGDISTMPAPCRSRSHNAIASIQQQQQQQQQQKPNKAVTKSSSEPPPQHISVSTTTTVHPSSSNAPVTKEPAISKPVQQQQQQQHLSSSVIFLNEQHYDPTNKLDISFVFEPDLACGAKVVVPSSPAAPPNGILLVPSAAVAGGLSFEATAPANGPSIRDLVGEAPPTTTAPVVTWQGLVPPPRDQDPNYQCGKFDLDKAVAFLYCEWENVSRFASKYPKRVVFFNNSANE